MNLLAFDTSSNALSVALLINNKIKAVHQLAPLQHAQKILSLIDTLLKNENMELNQLDAIAFGCGPGSFTGVRIATSVAQGLGYGLNLPLIPISSLATLAQAAYEDLGWKQLLVAVDARIQEVYWGAYEVNARGYVELCDKEYATPPDEITFPNQNAWRGVGNAWDVYQEQIIIKPEQIDTTRTPMAKGLLTLARIKYENQDWVTAEHALPTYLRDNIAKKS